MDIRREGAAAVRARRRLVYGAIAVAVATSAGLVLAGIEPAIPTVERSSVFFGTVARGEMLRQVRGSGTLVPLEIRSISVDTEGTVERIVVEPGQVVAPDTIIVELSNPQLQQAAHDAALELAAVEAEYIDLEISLERDFLTEQAAASRADSDSHQAALQAQADRQLFEQQLIAELQYQLSQVRAKELAGRSLIEQRRLDISSKSADARLRSKRARLEQIRALFELRQRQLEALHVRAGIAGVLQHVAVGVGESVPSGGTLAIVARPDTLKAEVRIPEAQAGEIVPHQTAHIDTRNGIVEGRVSRVDPSVREGTVTVDVTFVGELPPRTRSDLSIDATIEIERLPDVLHVGRPAYTTPGSKTTVFRLEPGGRTATRVPVELGRSSVNTVEVVSGLVLGDQIVLSETSRFADFQQIRFD